MYNITSSLSLSQALSLCPAAHTALQCLAQNDDNRAKIMSLAPDFSHGQDPVVEEEEDEDDDDEEEEGQEE